MIQTRFNRGIPEIGRCLIADDYEQVFRVTSPNSSPKSATPEIASQLGRRGIDVTTTVEIGLRSATDESQLALICQQMRVMVTHDIRI